MSKQEEKLESWEDGSPLVLAETKCTNCNCHALFFHDEPQFELFQEQGWGMRVRYWQCIYPNCYCHTGIGKPVRILLRDTELGKVVNA